MNKKRLNEMKRYKLINKKGLTKIKLYELTNEKRLSWMSQLMRKDDQNETIRVNE